MAAATVIATAIGAATVTHNGSAVSVAAVIAIAVGAATIAGFVVAALTYRVNQRRLRPIVICHEQTKRHLA